MASSGISRWGRRCLDPFTCQSRAIVGQNVPYGCKCATDDNSGIAACHRCEHRAGEFGQHCLMCNAAMFLHSNRCQENCDGLAGMIEYTPGNCEFHREHPGRPACGVPVNFSLVRTRARSSALTCTSALTCMLTLVSPCAVAHLRWQMVGSAVRLSLALFGSMRTTSPANAAGRWAKTTAQFATTPSTDPSAGAVPMAGSCAAASASTTARSATPSATPMPTALAPNALNSFGPHRINWRSFY